MNTAENLTGQYHEVPLHLIDLNIYNARNFDGLNQERQRKFDELVESVREQGVIQPITLRPSANGRYEVVAGERRFRASQKAERETIPAIVRALDDTMAVEIMATENLLRDDFTPLEEAKFFNEQVAKRGNTPDTFKVLSKTYGLDVGAIRLRIALLSLPEPIRKAFDDGTISIGHAELFCKISDPEFQTSAFNSCVANRWTIKELNAAIKNANPKMRWAKFDTEPCKSCLSNSSVQRQLFETAEDAACLSPECFRKKQFAFFDSGWQGSKGQELFKTNAFRFFDELTPSEIFPITVDNTHSRCESCPELVTAGTLAGGRVEGHERVCIGSKDCYNKCYATSVEEPTTTEEEATETTEGEQASADKKEPSGKDQVVDKATQEKRAKERSKQRGIDQREALYADKLPEYIGNLGATSPPAIRVALIALLLSSRTASNAVAECKNFTFEGQGKLKNGHDKNVVTTFVLNLPKTELLEVLKVAATGTIMGKDDLDSNPQIRNRVAALVEINIDDHWVVHEEYLKGQTKEEIVLMGEQAQMGLWLDEKIIAYKDEKFGAKKGWMSLKKSELIDCIVKSGTDLKGKVPLELTAE